MRAVVPCDNKIDTRPSHAGSLPVTRMASIARFLQEFESDITLLAGEYSHELSRQDRLDALRAEETELALRLGKREREYKEDLQDRIIALKRDSTFESLGSSH